ncbi:HipA domain-containing protein [Terriglobus roseus]|uniref:HipA domain-containing protein n=1 Tax=Terriglobus roseus TaxID=392734 RepID=UPI001FE1FC8A|nr:HipA domain-containing protein [Terriglobus roseus]
MAVQAVQAIRRMRGGAQSQLMLGADGKLWVVKFRNNPQGSRVLANELIATRLAEAAGLSVPACDAVDVSGWLIRNSPEMWVDVGRGERTLCAEGLAFGSQFVGGLMPGQVVDYLPAEQVSELRNVREFAGMLCIDKWTGNSNGRQAVFARGPRERKYRAVFIDQGYCFHANEWRFPDSPLRGVYASNAVYEAVTGWESFEPWISRVEEMEPGILWSIAEVVPPEWYGGDPAELEVLMEQMLKRRGRVRELITAFRESARMPFPNWGSVGRVVVPVGFGVGGVESKFVM